MSVRDKIMRVMSLALEINPPYISNIGEKKTAVFVDWSPHCNVLSVDIHRGGWDANRKDFERHSTYTSQKLISMETVHRNLDAIIARLIEIMEEDDSVV